MARGPHDLPAVDLKRDAIFLDVDGTLIDIAPRPDLVHVPPSLCEALARLETLSGGALALISGRPLSDLDSLFCSVPLPAVGSHGAEIRPRADGPVTAAMRLPDNVRAAFDGLTEAVPGLRVEDKGTSIAFHYRGIEAQEPALLADVETRMKRLTSDYEMLRGKAIVEIKHKGFNKGTALHALMKCPPFAGRRPIFHGDDVTDEDVFAALPAYGGIGISVGRHIRGAEYCVESPRDIRRWLLHLAGMAPEREG